VNNTAKLRAPCINTLIFFIILMNMAATIAYSAESLADKGIQIGDVHIFPVLDIHNQYDSNITRSENNTISSTQTLLSPSVNILTGEPEHYFSLQYRMEYDKFWSSSIDTYTDHFIDAIMHREFSNRGRLDIGLNYSRGHDQRGSTFTGIPTGFIEPNRWHQAAVISKLEYGSNGARIKLAAMASYAIKRFDNNQVLTASQDLNTTTLGGTLFFRIQSRLYALLDATYGIQDYQQTASPLSSREITLSSGLAWEVTARTSGSIKVGWQQRKLNISGQKSNALSWGASIDWKPLSYSTWTLSTSYANTETLGAVGTFVQRLDNELSWNHAWNQTLSHAINIAIGQDKYRGTARTDRLYDTGLSLIYTLNSWLDISSDYAYSKRSSTIRLLSYKQHVFSVAFHIAP